jgi:hypothetical protein
MLTSRFFKKAFPFLLVGIALLALFSIFWTIFENQRTPQRIRNLAVTKSVLHSPKDTWNNIHPFQLFDTHTDPAVIAHSYSSVWGADVSKFAVTRAVNPNMYLAYYIPFNRDYGTFENNSSINDLSYWQGVHPDWVLYQCDRVTPAYSFGNPNVPLDFTNPAMIAWEMQTYALPASQHGYDAIAADNVDFGNWYNACGIYKNGQWVQLFSGQPEDPAWRTAMLNWLAQAQTALQSLAHPLALIPNLAFGGLSPTDPIILKAADLSDGVLDEGGYTNYGNGYVTGKEWIQHVQYIEYLQSENKPTFIVDNFPTINRFNVQWALASYLMGKEHLSEIYIIKAQGYGVNSWLGEYNTQIGSPRGSMYASQYVFWRSYSNGLSIVNPDPGRKFTITLNSRVHYVNLYGNSVSGKVTLPAHSGLVLLIQSQGSSHSRH